MKYTIQDLTDGKVAFFLEESTTPEQLKEVLTKAFPYDWFCKEDIETYEAYVKMYLNEYYYKSDKYNGWQSNRKTTLPTTSINTFLVKFEHGKWYKNGSDWILKYDEMKDPEHDFYIGYFDGDFRINHWSGFGLYEAWTLATKEDLAKLGNEWEPYWEDTAFETIELAEPTSKTVIGDDHITTGIVGSTVLASKVIEAQEKLIRRFPSGAVRSNNEGRPRPDWISPYAIEEISKVMVSNENDFGACNYMLGIPETECLESLCRHVEELKEAILIKKDMNEAKIIARSVGFNSIALIHTLVLKERNLYKEIYNQTEVISVEEAKQGNNFTDK